MPRWWDVVRYGKGGRPPDRSPLESDDEDELWNSRSGRAAIRVNKFLAARNALVLLGVLATMLRSF